MSLIDTRGHQMFPVLDAAQTETAKRFASGTARDHDPPRRISSCRPSGRSPCDFQTPKKPASL